MKKLPIGRQTFRELIEEKLLYVDKTEDINKLLENDSKYFFLSRPRRFGKSLLITTLEEIFLGNKDLFKDLWIYDKIDFKKYSVIKLDFSNIDSSTPERLEKSLSVNLLKIAKNYKLKLDTNLDYKDNFAILIEDLGKIEKVVILIDEYDKPIIEHINEIEIVEKTREILKNFYTTIKASDKYIKFCFLTGVSKFSKVSIFSGLNNLTDITLDKNYSNILGYTQTELEYYFENRIVLLSEELNISIEETKNKLKIWYNGYSWDGKNFVYNPFSILNVLKDKNINNYWFKSGTPTFLIKLIKDKNIDLKQLENFQASDELLESFEIERINIPSLLFQTGYLTIKKIEDYGDADRTYILNYPNMEVKESLLKNILVNFLDNSNEDVLVSKLYKALNKNDLDLFFKILFDIFAHIPSVIFMKDKEAYYHTIIYLILTIIGVRIKTEVWTNKGRIDAVVETQDNIYIFEFKMNNSNQAIRQIENKKYYESYILSNKPIYLIGVSFDSEYRNIKDWKLIQYEN